MTQKRQMSESFRLSALLALTGGFFDAYTYLERGGVFANAQTGNVVLLGVRVMNGDWQGVLRYLIPICAFVLGVMTAERMRSHFKGLNGRLHWRQIVVFGEMVLVGIVSFLPESQTINTAVNIIISFVCAMQVQAFRKVHGAAVSTTMCTGNLRTGTEALVHWRESGDREQLMKSGRYFAVVACFAAGAAVGAGLSACFGGRSLLFCCGVLAAGFLLMCLYKEA